MAERKIAASGTERLALLAHDLRTPLAAMKLTADLIARDGLTELQAERLQILIRSIDALDDMAGELIRDPEAASCAAGGAADLGLIVSETGALLKAPACAKGLGFSLSVPGEAVPVDAAKAALLRRIVAALLDNAIKYTDVGSVDVRLELSRSGGGPEARITITDTGPGIDPQERERLFRPFVRGKTGRAKADGSGLGLWGAVQLAGEAGGTLRLVSAAEAGSGIGCRFELTLPLTPVAAVRQVAASGAPFQEAPVAGIHVLIVDDNDTNRRLLAALLESFSITSDQAGGGEDAVLMVENGSYDAVLLDLHMPGLDGMETAERIRAGTADQDMPLIAVTAAAETADEARMRAAGFVDMIAKPLSPAKLFTVLEHARRFHQNRSGTD